jgi:MFS transporter, FHS family, glucose/mannose:H+ symporter
MDVQARDPSRWRRQLAVVASFATMFMLGITISLLGPSLPALAGRVRIALPQAGLFFSFLSLGSVAATLGLARWMDRPVRHLLVTAGALLAGCALILAAASETFAQAGAAITLTGLAMSTASIAPNAIIADLYRQRAGQVLNALHACTGLGSFAGPLLIAASLRLGGSYAEVFRLAGVLYLWAGLLWILSRPPQPLGTAGAGQAGGAASLAPLLPLFLFAALYTGTEQAFGGWLFTYSRRSAALDPAAASLLTALFWFAILAGRLAAIGVLGRASNRVTLIGGVLLGAAGILTTVLGSLSAPLLWLGTMLVGFGFGPLFPTTLALGAQLTPARAGAVSSLVVASGSIGAMILPYVSGSVMGRVGPARSMAFLIVPLAAMLLCLWQLGRRDKHVRNRVCDQPLGF